MDGQPPTALPPPSAGPHTPEARARGSGGAADAHVRSFNPQPDPPGLMHNPPGD